MMLAPASVKEGGSVDDAAVQYLLAKCKSGPAVRDLYAELHEYVMAADPEGQVYRKAGSTLITYYCPEHVFLYVTPQKKGLKLGAFTRGEALAGWEPAGTRWAVVRATDPAEWVAAQAGICEALQRIRAAVQAHEPTAWVGLPKG